MREIPVKGGYVALVDDSDYERVAAHKWTYLKAKGSLTIYARTSIARRTVYMHRFILGEPQGLVVDHEDGNGLNNQRSNLVPKTHQANVFHGLVRRDIAAWRAKKEALRETSKSLEVETPCKPPEQECS